MLLEDHGLDVGRVDHAVDEGELHLRQLGGDGLDGRGLGEAHGDDDVGAAPGHVAQGLLALGLGRGLELHVGDVGRLAEILGAVEGGLVEGFVELAAHVVEDARRHVGGLRGYAYGDAERYDDGKGEAGESFAHGVVSLFRSSAVAALPAGSLSLILARSLTPTREPCKWRSGDSRPDLRPARGVAADLRRDGRRRPLRSARRRCRGAPAG